MSSMMVAHRKMEAASRSNKNRKTEKMKEGRE